MKKAILLIATVLITTLTLFYFGCGGEEEVNQPTKTDDSETVTVDISYADLLDGGDVSAAMRQDLANQDINLSQDVEVRVRSEGEDWLISDYENERAYSAIKTGDKIEIGNASFINFPAERQAILDTWQSFMTAYNDRDMTEVAKLWTNKDSDYLFVNISDNERIDAAGSGSVRNTLEKLAKGHQSTKNDRWTGSNMNTVYIRKRGSTLEASAHGPNALRKGNTWAYFQKIRNNWRINKVESIETRNMGYHKVIEIHENKQLDGIGYFDDPTHKVD